MVHQCPDIEDLRTQLKNAGDKLVVIDFHATWCGPCKVIAPKVEEMSKAMDNVVFLKVDVDENEEAAKEYNVSAMPTFIFIKNNKKVSFFNYILYRATRQWQTPFLRTGIRGGSCNPSYWEVGI
jgi:thioredoxin 1